MNINVDGTVQYLNDIVAKFASNLHVKSGTLFTIRYLCRARNDSRKYFCSFDCVLSVLWKFLLPQFSIEYLQSQVVIQFIVE